MCSARFEYRKNGGTEQHVAVVSEFDDEYTVYVAERNGMEYLTMPSFYLFV